VTPFERFLDVLLPYGGCVAVEVETYFDESGSHDGAPVLCVAGYIIGKSDAIRMDAEWRGVLRARNLPYFRMSECAHGNGPFAAIAKNDRIQLVARLIQLIKQYTIQGIAVTVNVAEFEQNVPHHPMIGRPYSFCAHVILAGISSWLGASKAVTSCAYFFEAGHASQSEANNIMNTLFRNPKAKESYRYAGHAFVEKEQTPLVQAADLLAWQWYTDKRHQLEGRPRRRDCAKLMEHHHNAVHVNPEKLVALRDAMPFILGGEDDFAALMRLQKGSENVVTRVRP
jgi:hypothetical protein